MYMCCILLCYAYIYNHHFCIYMYCDYHSVATMVWIVGMADNNKPACTAGENKGKYVWEDSILPIQSLL